MFGDKLTLDDCRQAIDDLKKCDAPFQCAHGRPSVAPILELSKLSMPPPKMTMKKLYKVNSREETIKIWLVLTCCSVEQP